MRSHLLGFLVVVALAVPALVLIRGDGAPVPVSVTVEDAQAAPPARVPSRPPNADELSMFFCGVRVAESRRAPHCVHGLMRLYRACGVDAGHPKTPRCWRLLRRVARADRAAAARRR